MTRTDVMASSRPQTPSAAPMRRGSSSVLRGLSALSVALFTALAIMVPGTAVAAEPTSGYGQTQSTTTPTTPATTPSTTPSTGTLPAKEAETPTPKTAEKEPEPAKTSSAPSKTKATTLPFTGFDLRWDIGLGLVLMGAGFSIVAVQRRQRRDSGH